MTFNLSSNCPRYLVPATIELISKDRIRLSKRFLGQSPSNIFIANPSTIAVLPQPGSPMIIGLFFFLRDKICAILIISFSRPTTGSNLPSSANLIKSRLKLSKTGVLLLVSTFFGFFIPSSTESVISFFYKIKSILFKIQ